LAASARPPTKELSADDDDGVDDEGLEFPSPGSAGVAMRVRLRLECINETVLVLSACVNCLGKGEAAPREAEEIDDGGMPPSDDDDEEEKQAIRVPLPPLEKHRDAIFASSGRCYALKTICRDRRGTDSTTGREGRRTKEPFFFFFFFFSKDKFLSIWSKSVSLSYFFQRILPLLLLSLLSYPSFPLSLTRGPALATGRHTEQHSKQ
jgi:hypothetical protein